MAVSLSDIISYKRLVAAGNSEVWYGGTGVSAGTMTELAAANGDVDTTDQLNMFEAFQKAFIVNGTNLKIVDFANTKLTVTALTTAPTRGATVTQATSNATMIVDFVNTAKTEIYGYTTSGTFVTTEGYDLSGGSMDPTTRVPSAVAQATTTPHWYDYTVYPGGSSGSLPAKAYIGCLYRGRIVLSGNPNKPFQWYMSRQTNPYDYAYVANDAQSPVAGGNSDAGEIGDIIRALIPYKDDYLIFGCASSIWIMRGDPASGGSLDELDLTVGMFGAHSWCFDGEGNLYFFGTNGIYRVPRGFQTVENLTKFSLPKLIADEAADSSTHRITMAYDRLRLGILICITKLADGTNSNYWYDLRTEGFFPESYPEECGVYSLFHYDANDPTFKNLLLGTMDGYLRKFDESQKDDDIGGTDETISSYLTLVEPLGDKEDVKGLLKSLTVTTAGGASGGDFGDTDGVSYEYHSADDAETVLEDIIDGATAQESGTLSGTGRKKRIRKRIRGHYLGIKFLNSTASETFAIEKVTGEIKPTGKD